MTDDPVPPRTLDDERRSLSDPLSLVDRLSWTLRSGVLTTGDLAGLRRMQPARLDAPGFWKLAGLVLDGALPGDAAERCRREVAWAAVAVAFAHLGDLQDRSVPLGRALAEAGYAEARFVRLLRADDERLLDELPQVARYLAAKSARADLTTAALLLVSPDPEPARQRLARDYYSSVLRDET
jgi:CRISPR system Cascade subunit CasB